jgi:hypothetical protein
MKTKMMRYFTAALILGLAPGLLAQEDKEDFFKPYISLGLNFAAFNGKELTHKTFHGIGSYTAEAGVQFGYDPAGVFIRPNVGYARLRADYIDEEALACSLAAVYVGFDVVYQPEKWGNFSAYLGPSFHSWQVEELHPWGSDMLGETRMKFGWRFGVGYDFLKDFRVDLSFTQTEWRSNEEIDYIPGYNPSKPAYFSIKASYKF